MCLLNVRGDYDTEVLLLLAGLFDELLAAGIAHVSDQREFLTAPSVNRPATPVVPARSVGIVGVGSSSNHFTGDRNEQHSEPGSARQRVCIEVARGVGD
jgi:hypothetical protein